MINEARIWNKKNIDNYLEIYIKSDIHKIIKFGKKDLYKKRKKYRWFRYQGRITNKTRILLLKMISLEVLSILLKNLK